MSDIAEGRNLNPSIMENPSKAVADLEKQRFVKETAFFRKSTQPSDDDEADDEKIDSYEIFDMLRHINDPEHPLTLEQLRVIKPELITVSEDNYVQI